jgi:hypothetical protein
MSRFEDRYPLHKPLAKKTPPAKSLRTETGVYTGSIGTQCELTSQEQRRVRETLAQGPISLLEIAKGAGLDAGNLIQLNALTRYVNHLKEDTREVEDRYEQTARGKKFIGLALSAHGQKLLEIS